MKVTNEQILDAMSIPVIRPASIRIVRQRLGLGSNQSLYERYQSLIKKGLVEKVGHKYRPVVIPVQYYTYEMGIDGKFRLYSRNPERLLVKQRKEGK